MEEVFRWCDQGCGYKIPDDYKWYETTCGACLNGEGDNNE